MSDTHDKPELQPKPSQVQEVRRGDVVSVAASWRGPLPPPEALRAYNDVFPGCAERIVAMAEAESAHRRTEEKLNSETDRLLVEGEIASERRGMWLAFIIAVLMIGTGSFLAFEGRLAWGVGLIGADLLALVGLFIYGRHRVGSAAQGPEQEESQQKLPFPD